MEKHILDLTETTKFKTADGKEADATKIIVDHEPTGYVIIDGVLYDMTGDTCYILKVKCFKRQDREGREFIAYKALCDNKRYLDLSFTRSCGNPDYSQDFVLVLPSMNVDTNRLYPRVYVGDYEEILPYIKELKDYLKFVRSGE